MIICDVFPEDNAADVKNIQHDAYDEALGLMVSRTRTAYLLACRILNVENNVRTAISANNKYDHRDIQAAHDLLAAIWRYLTNKINPNLPFAEFSPKDIRTEWLAWLENELVELEADPVWVRSVTAASAGLPETPIGSRIEPALEVLFERYRSSVPFLADWHRQRSSERYE